MSVSLLSDKPVEIQQLAHTFLQRQPVTVKQAMSFLGQATFCADGHAQLHHLCHVIQSDILKVFHLYTFIYFHSLSFCCASAPEAQL